MAYSTAQLVSLAVAPKMSASISIPCSIFIIKVIIEDHQKGRGKAIDRVIAAMNFVDILASIGWWCSTWLVPKGADGAIFSAGNTHTCAFQGFLLQIAIGAPLYNCSLSIFYLLTIRHRWSDDRLRHIERWVHGSVITFTLGTGVLGIPLKLFNHIGTVCWIIGSPQGCGSSNREPSDVPCDRGEHAWIYGIALFYGPLWVCVILTITAMVLIYRNIEQTAQRSLRHSFVPRTNSILDSFQRSLHMPRLALNPDDVALQAFLYTFSFFLTWTPSTIWSIAYWFGAPMFWLDFLASLCEPLQGVWNFLVFIRPRKALRNRVYDFFSRICCCCFCCRCRPNEPPTEEQPCFQFSSGDSNVDDILMDFTDNSIVVLAPGSTKEDTLFEKMDKCITQKTAESQPCSKCEMNLSNDHSDEYSENESNSSEEKREIEGFDEVTI